MGRILGGKSFQVAALGAILCCSADSVLACRGSTRSDAITDLSVTEGFEDALVSWKFPEEACMEKFVIEATPVDLQGEEAGKTTWFETRDGTQRSMSLDGLDAGVTYAIKVTVQYGDDLYGPELSTTAVPIVRCNKSGAPGTPKNFFVKNQSREGYTLKNGDEMEVCWTPPNVKDAGCPDEYTLAARVQPQSPSDLFDGEHEWTIEKFPSHGCHTISGIPNGKVIELGLRAYNAPSMTSGGVKLIQSFATNQWQCVAGGDSYYDLCQAAKTQQCQAMNCDAIASNDMCGHPSVRKYDVEKLTVVQYCAQRCGCPLPDREEKTNIPYSQPDTNDWVCCVQD